MSTFCVVVEECVVMLGLVLLVFFGGFCDGVFVGLFVGFRLGFCFFCF